MSHGSRRPTAPRSVEPEVFVVSVVFNLVLTRSTKTGYWKVTGRIDFKILISNFWPPGEGFSGFRPQIRLQHAKISMLTSFEVIWLQLKGFPKFGPVAFQYPVFTRNIRQS